MTTSPPEQALAGNDEESADAETPFGHFCNGLLKKPSCDEFLSEKSVGRKVWVVIKSARIDGRIVMYDSAGVY